ncbi:30S ribosomal protein S12 methylthiotransferase accessory factor YcaO [Marinobacterium rhizophilum]|uniref:YcaO-like family protein n=1 Tax=Marinobacterium rhizophilum TaxID=420402 RepID=A0ABY5HR05_9GAMM|nr:30S ribosomal protein S12 methylthiotransferase accessory factor YcaO [Marinobacterium rhizophilum]UTW13610.1 YcaO-like family protein [Marinobacterium rhizophilum]
MSALADNDTPLDESIRLLRQGLQALGFTLEDVCWFNPVPNVWSVQLRERSCPLLTCSGRGGSRDAAMASALREFYERLSCNRFFADYYFGKELAEAPFVHYPNERWFALPDKGLPDGLLDEATRDHFDLHGQLRADMLVDTNSGNEQRGICAIPFTRQRTGEQVWLPVNILNNLYTSNGMAAGCSRWEARTQALSEIFERHIKNTILTAGISLPQIPESVLSRYPAFCESVAALRAAGFVVVVQDASLGGKFPLVNITLINPTDGGCCAAFGAHPKFERALERTLTGVLQGRELDDLKGFALPCFDLSAVAEQDNLEAHFIDSSGVVAWDLLSRKPDYNFTQWNVEGDSQAEFDHLCYLIHRVDMDIYIADHEHLGVYCCQIVVPGMADLYPVDYLVHQNNNRAIAVRGSILRLARLSVQEAALLEQWLDRAELDDYMSVSELLCLCADPETFWGQLSVGELRCLLALRTGELSRAQEWSDWVMHSGLLGDERLRLFRCINQLLQFRLDPERHAEQFDYLLQQIYGQPLLERVRLMLGGESVFVDAPVVGENLEGLGVHRALLDIYQRLQQVKAQHYQDAG